MRIVAIDTSGRHGSLATLIGETNGAQLQRQIALTGDQRTAQALAPTLRNLLADVGWPTKSIELVAVAAGPGSFTGLRIGVTTAKTLAYAVGAQVVGVNTLAVLAEQAILTKASPLWTIMDAQRHELFVAKFDAYNHSDSPIDCDTHIVPQDTWLAGLRPGDYVTGPALRRVASQLPVDVHPLPDDLCQPTAAAVGFVGWRAYQAGRRDDVWQLVPNYYRPSYAEEKKRT